MLVGVSEQRLGQTRHDHARLSTTSEYGVLGVRDVDFRLDRLPASADVADLVERHWLVHWDLPEGRRGSVTLLPHPCANLAFDRGQLAIFGVGRGRFTYEFTRRGRVFGVKFRPGAFLPFLRGPVSQLTDQMRPLATLWGAADAEGLAGDLAHAADLEDLATVAERHLRAHWPEPDTEVAQVGRIVHALLYDRSVARVDDVATRFGLSSRQLQRLFQRYVGVSPKWVLQRYRLHEAAARLADGTSGTWAEVAVELGYFDQSHFIRDFTRAIGMTAVAYADACRRHQAPVSA
jgi:AraC-like DNA-binding protein